MSDRPTYKDYLFHQQDGFIRSGGQYYTIVGKKSKQLAWLLFGLLTAPLAALICLSLTNIIWFNWLGEATLVLFPAALLLPWLTYRRTHFNPVAEYTEAWYKAASLEYSSAVRVTMIVLNAFVAVLFLYMYLPGGYIVSSIRSRLDGGGVVSAAFSLNGTGTFYWDDVVTNESIPVQISGLSDDGRVGINISVVHTPQTAKLLLDGKPIPNKYQPDKTLTNDYEWEDYFKQETSFTISSRLLHDGSTLTLDCGSLHREWVFDVAEGDGA